MSTFGHLLQSPEIKLLGWSLLHFLWQGAILGTLLATTLFLMRRHTANARYLVACGALLLMAASPVATWSVLQSQAGDTAATFRPGIRHALEGRKQKAEGSPNGLSLEVTGDVPSRLPSASRGPAPPLRGPRLLPSAFASGVWRLTSSVRQVAQRLEPSLPWLVAGWLAGVLVFMARLLGGWVMVRQLRGKGARLIEGGLCVRVTEIARRMGIRRPVDLLESERVVTPAVMGWLRAAILVPAGAVTGLPPAAMEALLAHELAHVRRADYCVNLLQMVVETLLFYHPAVWWVSHTIRIERENCCDDLVVAVLDDRITYARALTELAESLTAPGAWALASGGGDLLARVRRILGLPNERNGSPLVPFGGSLMTLLLSIAVLVSLQSSPPSAAVVDTPGEHFPPAATGSVSVTERPPVAITGIARRATVKRTDPTHAAVTEATGENAKTRKSEDAKKAENGTRRDSPRSSAPSRLRSFASSRSLRPAPDPQPQPAPMPETLSIKLAQAGLDNTDARLNRALEEERDRRAARQAQEEPPNRPDRMNPDRLRAREEARRMRQDARRQAAQARKQALRAGADARRAGADARRAAQEQARRTRDRSQPERRPGAEMSPQDREEMRRELERARQEIQRAREETRRELERARPEIERAREEARRAMEQARPEIERAKEEARRAIEKARRDSKARSGRDRMRPGEADRITEETLRQLDRIWPEVQRATEAGLRAAEPEVQRAIEKALRAADVQGATEAGLRAAEEALRALDRPSSDNR